MTYIAVVREPNARILRRIEATAERFGAEVISIGGAATPSVQWYRDIENAKATMEAGPFALWVPLETRNYATPLTLFQPPTNGEVVYVMGPQNGTLKTEEILRMNGPTVVVETGTEAKVLPLPVLAGIVLHHHVTALVPEGSVLR